jgi:tRNA pseudouridine55 synthase
MMNTPNESVRLKDPVDGILLVNKPRGPSSNAILQKVKYLVGAKKAGHTGSLDPLATGMLPICFGEATKISQYLLDADKSYIATGVLGVKTNTADAMGDITARVDDFEVSEVALREVLNHFVGRIQQTPSMFSALKHQGRPLYQYARKGIEIDRPARNITIYALALDNYDGRTFQLTVRCSKGSYIRNLVEDIGDSLGVGAHVSKLHRLYTAGFEHESMVTVEELSQLSLEGRRHLLMPSDKAIAYLPRIELSTEQTRLIQQGQLLTMPTLGEMEGVFRLYDPQQHFLGLGELHAPQVLKAKRLLAVRTAG